MGLALSLGWTHISFAGRNDGNETISKIGQKLLLRDQAKNCIFKLSEVLDETINGGDNMTTKVLAKAEAFLSYADETENMQFGANRSPDGTWHIIPLKRYDPVCVRAVWRNFNQEWNSFKS